MGPTLLAFLPRPAPGLMKVLSGAGARGLMIDVLQTHGVDSFAGRLAAIIQGLTETTFYVLAVYLAAWASEHPPCPGPRPVGRRVGPGSRHCGYAMLR